MRTSRADERARGAGDRRGRRHGPGICLDLAADGRTVAVADLRLDGAKETASAVADSGGRAVPVELDVTSSESVAAGVAAAADELGPIDIAVNNAGWDELRPFLETD
jgi:2-hydroxycyclohexanecarboxyl-CoA dehydrogenase